MLVDHDAEFFEAMSNARDAVQRARDVCEGSRRVVADTQAVIKRGQKARSGPAPAARRCPGSGG
jgi:hypothetical protein